MKADPFMWVSFLLVGKVNLMNIRLIENDCPLRLLVE